MSLLSKITTGRKGRPQKVVIFAPEGFGKSSLASRFPSPLFLDVEDSTSQLDVARLGRDDLPDLRTLEKVLDEVIATQPCKTLVIDTIDWLEEMGAEELCAEHKCKNLEEVAGGFGKGYNYLTTRVSLTLAKLDRVVNAGVHVVLLAHASIVRFDPPDGAGAFDRYELKLYKDRKGGKGTASLIKEWADMVLFGNWRVQIAEKGKGDNVTYKGVGGKERQMHTTRSSAWDAKNRHGMADVEKWDVEVIKKAFLSVGAPWDEAGNAVAGATNGTTAGRSTAPAEPKPEPKPEAKPEPKPEEKPDDLDMTPVPDPALKAVCEPHAAAITDYLLRNGKITAGQDWRYMSADFAARVLKNPAKFINIATKGGVAA